MPRSVRVQQESIEKVKLAVRRNGFHSQRALAEAVGFSLSTVNNFLTGKPVDYATSVEICQMIGLDCLEITKLNPVHSRLSDGQVEGATTRKHQDWGEIIDVSNFHKRREELETLKQWIVDDRYHLVAVIGIAGIGKTALSVKLAEFVQDEFEFLIWRSLRNAPPLQVLLEDLISFLSEQQETNLETIDNAIETLLKYLRTSRCLIVLDSWESILDRGDCVKSGREAGEEEYKHFLMCLEKSNYQSCLVLTSQKKPEGLNLSAGEGLLILEAQTNIKYEFVLTGSVDEVSRQKLEAIVAHLQTITGDSSLTLLRVEPGSIKLILEGSEAGFKQLENFFNQGRLLEIEGFSIKSITTLKDPVRLDQNYVVTKAKQYGLTKRETEIWLLRQLENCSYQEIASRLSISVNTVKRHLKKIYAKRSEVFNATFQEAKELEQTANEILPVILD
jgi:RNA polymerase sigma factor (sigma-70 family)